MAESASDPIRFVERAVPEPAADEVLVKVVAAGISPMILKLLRLGRFGQLPTVIGHEAAGVVVKSGGAASEPLIGRRVRVHPMLSCRSCEYCLTDREQMCAQTAMIGAAAHGSGPNPGYERYHDGGLAEYVRVPIWLIDEIPDHVSFEVAAKLHDLANAYRALRTASIPVGGTLVITAATGAMATASLLLAPHLGVGRVILVGRSAERLRAVAGLPVRIPIDSIAFDELPDDWEQSGALTRRLRELAPDGPHAVVDFLTAGAGATQALQSLRMGGSLVHMGGGQAPIDVPLRILMNSMWSVIGSRACTRADVAAVLRLMESGALDAEALITHRWPLAEADRAFATLEARAEPIWMGVVAG
ncbi:zinc-dependent alcohol dehydrogenase [Microbacterium sp. AGC85]